MTERRVRSPMPPAAGGTAIPELLWGLDPWRGWAALSKTQREMLLVHRPGVLSATSLKKGSKESSSSTQIPRQRLRSGFTRTGGSSDPGSGMAFWSIVAERSARSSRPPGRLSRRRGEGSARARTDFASLRARAFPRFEEHFPLGGPETNCRGHGHAQNAKRSSNRSDCDARVRLVRHKGIGGGLRHAEELLGRHKPGGSDHC